LHLSEEFVAASDFFGRAPDKMSSAEAPVLCDVHDLFDDGIM
jgi:hypothetical protein